MSDLASRVLSSSRLTGVFRLRSGGTSTGYFDKYRFESDPALLREICAALAPQIPAGTDALAGLELGGVPIAVVLAQLTGIPAVFVRKERKDYGTCRLVEGVDIAGRQLLVVEDVATTGGQMVKSIEDLRREGARVDTAICVVDRQAGATARLAEVGVQLKALFSRDDLESSTLKLTGLDHIVLCVRDVERTITFYRDLLGMEPREERPGKWSLHFGANKISLQDATAHPEIARDTVPGTGNFCVLTEEPVDRLASVLRERGIEIVAGPDLRDGATGRIRSVYFRDPDGNLVEVSNRL